MAGDKGETPEVVHERARRLLARLEDRLEKLSSYDRELDALSALTELAALRMQMIMARRTKAFETIGNILKKMADAQEALIRQMK